MWEGLKQAVRDVSGLSPGSLHVVLAIVIFLVALLVLRRDSRAFWTVVVLQLVNEALDMIGDARSGQGVRVMETLVDTAITVGTAALMWGLALLLGRAMRNAFSAGD